MRAMKAKAGTQYGDLVGTVSVDGFQGLVMTDLYPLGKSIDVPGGYHWSWITSAKDTMAECRRASRSWLSIMEFSKRAAAWMA